MFYTQSLLQLKLNENIENEALVDRHLRLEWYTYALTCQQPRIHSNINQFPISCKHILAGPLTLPALLGIKGGTVLGSTIENNRSLIVILMKPMYINEDQIFPRLWAHKRVSLAKS